MTVSERADCNLDKFASCSAHEDASMPSSPKHLCFDRDLQLPIKHFVPREKALFNFRANRALRLKTKRPKAPSGARSQRNEPFVFDRALLRSRSL